MFEMPDLTYGTSYSSSLQSIATWSIISLVLAAVGAFIIYFLFVKDKKNYDNKFLTWLKSFLDFQSMLIEPMLKISYLFFALLITLSSLAIIGSNFVGFLVYLIAGNIILRVCYEFGMILIGIWQNTRDINKKTK